MERRKIGWQRWRAYRRPSTAPSPSSFVGIFIYLFIVFGLLSLHAWVVLSAENISYRFYGMALTNALVLSKIILLAEGFRFADKFKNQPLVYPVAYKAVAFTALLFAAYVVEEVLVGLWHGKSLAESFPAIGDGLENGWLRRSSCASPSFPSLPSGR
jgi:hypothetical protein